MPRTKNASRPPLVIGPPRYSRPVADGEAELTGQWPATMPALDLDIKPESCIVNQKARRYNVYATSSAHDGKNQAAGRGEYLYLLGMEYDDSGGACMRGTCRSFTVSGDFKICFSEDDVEVGRGINLEPGTSQRDSPFLWREGILRGVLWNGSEMTVSAVQGGTTFHAESEGGMLAFTSEEGDLHLSAQLGHADDYNCLLRPETIPDKDKPMPDFLSRWIPNSLQGETVHASVSTVLEPKEGEVPEEEPANATEQLISMGFEAAKVKAIRTYRLTSVKADDTDVSGDVDKALGFLLAQGGSILSASASDQADQADQGDQAELAEWRNGKKKFVPEIINVETCEVESGIVSDLDPSTRARGKRPLSSEIEEGGGVSAISRLVRIKEEKGEVVQLLQHKAQAVERLEDERDILEDTVAPMGDTINALQTKVDGLYAVAFALAHDQSTKDALRPLAGGGIDVKKRDAQTQIVNHVCDTLASYSVEHICNAAMALGIQGAGQLEKALLLKKLREALGGKGPSK